MTPPDYFGTYHPSSIAKSYDEDGVGEKVIAVYHNHAEMIDTVSEIIRQNLKDNKDFSLDDYLRGYIAGIERKIMGEMLIKLLTIIGDAKNPKLVISLLISSSGLPIIDKPDLQVAKDHGLTRAAYSAAKIKLEKKLGLKPAPHAKSEAAREQYSNTNPKKFKTE